MAAPRTTNYIVQTGTTPTSSRRSLFLPLSARLSRPIARGPMEISVPANYVSRTRVSFRVDSRPSARNYVKLQGGREKSFRLNSHGSFYGLNVPQSVHRDPDGISRETKAPFYAIGPERKGMV